MVVTWWIVAFLHSVISKQKVRRPTSYTFYAVYCHVITSERGVFSTGVFKLTV